MLSKNDSSHSFTPTDLRCEYLVNPLAVNTSTPRLSWRVEHPQRGQKQSAFQVIAGRERSCPENDPGVLWNSGKIASSQSIQVVYAGQPLTSRETCYWKVRVWDSNGTPSSWSEPAIFGVGLLHATDWHGSWIAHPHPVRGKSPLFRRAFSLEKEVARVRCFICGLGYYELSINGRKVGQSELDPGWTDYQKRALYTAYDVQDFLSEGENVIGIQLGEGWYGNDHESMVKIGNRRPEWIGFPCLRFQMVIEYAGGGREEVLSEPVVWAVSDSAILANNVYDGETYDARLEKDGWNAPGYAGLTAEWVTAVSAPAPKGKLLAQVMEPIRVMGELQPVRLLNPAPGIYVYDFGQNMAGWAEIRVCGARGSTVTLKFAELLDAAGLVNQKPLRGARACDRYILKGDGLEIYQPRFTYHGFRYVQVEGYPGVPALDSLVAKTVRSSAEKGSSFHCSSPLLNTIHHNVVWTEASNMHSVLTDCPQRDERMGWLNDATVRLEETVYNFSLPALLAKWVDDIEDTQDETGAITDTAPFVWGSRPADPVSTSYLLIPWLLYQHYGDVRIIEEHYAGLKKWFDCLGARAEENIINTSYYGDWASPQPYCITNTPVSAITPGKLISTGYYYYDALLLSQMARIIGKDEEAREFAAKAEQISRAFNHTYLDTETGVYALGSQASQAFALYLDLAPQNTRQRVIDRLVNDVVATHNYHLTTGNLCSKYILEVLAQNGHIDTAYRLATQTTYPSWGYMLEHGATTIWERWELMTGGEMNSHSHPMYATIGCWFYKILAGISPDLADPGYGSITFKPYLPGELQFVEAAVKTMRGVVSSAWYKTDENILLQVSIPFNSQARVFVPKPLKGSAAKIYEGSRLIWQDGALEEPGSGIISAEEQEDAVVFTVGSGSYFFTVPNSAKA